MAAGDVKLTVVFGGVCVATTTVTELGCKSVMRWFGSATTRKYGWARSDGNIFGRLNFDVPVTGKFEGTGEIVTKSTRVSDASKFVSAER
jgi:hypothetical protein